MNNNESHHELATLCCALLLCVLCVCLSGGGVLVTFVFAQQGSLSIHVERQRTNCPDHKSGDRQEASERVFDSLILILRQKIKV